MKQDILQGYDADFGKFICQGWSDAFKRLNIRLVQPFGHDSGQLTGVTDAVQIDDGINFHQHTLW